MYRTITGLATAVILLAMATAEARPKIEIQPFGALRTATSLGDGYYENNMAQKLSVAPGPGFGLTLDIPIGRESRIGQLGMIELGFSYQQSDFRFEPESMEDMPDSILDRFEVEDDQIILGDIQVMYLHAGGLYRFGNLNGWLPFVNGGLGATFFAAPDGQADSKSKFSLSLGVGVSRMFNETIGARLGFRSYFTSLPADEAYWIDPWGGIWAVADDNWLFQSELSLGLVFRL